MATGAGGVLERLWADVRANPGVWVGVAVGGGLLVFAYIQYANGSNGSSSASSGATGLVTPANGYGSPDWASASNGSSANAPGAAQMQAELDAIYSYLTSQQTPTTPGVSAPGASSAPGNTSASGTSGTTGTTVPSTPAIPAPVAPWTPTPAAPASTAQYVTVAPWTRVNTPWNSTLSGIAGHYGESLGTVETLNPGITNPNLIYPGQQVRYR